MQHHDDDELDIAEEEAEVTPEEEAVTLTASDSEIPVEGDDAIVAVVPEFEEEIKQASADSELEEDESGVPKPKTHQVPPSLIERDLDPEDWFDKGSI